jgi:YVTN family beta-propeller protein
VANQFGDTVSVVNGATNTITTTIPVGAAPQAVAVNPTTNTIYVANANAGTLSVINGGTNALTSTITVGTGPGGVAVDTVADSVYVANDSSVSVINGVTNVVSSTIETADSSSTLTTSTLALGTNSITVQYSGDANNASATSAALSQVVDQATPQISWIPTPVFLYGTALGAAQENALVSWPQFLPGTFTYSPAAGTLLAAGVQTLSVTFTPTDTAHYTTATATAQVEVIPSGVTISWPTPAAITYGTALSSTQLDATISSPSGLQGTFAYNPPAGTVPPVGTDTLSVTFTPSSPDYSVAMASVPLKVNAGSTYDAGTVTLTVNGSPYVANYGQGSTPSSVASALAQAASGNSSVSVTAVDDSLYLKATGTGSATDYSYSLVGHSTAGFSEPSFVPSSETRLRRQRWSTATTVREALRRARSRSATTA